LLIPFVYLLLLIAITFLQKKDWLHPIFKASNKVSWWISGLSLYMLDLSVDQGQLLTGIISEYGMKGMWMIWAGWLGTFVIPLVFAPLWQKMNFITDNQFLTFRFPGKSGKILHLFRAVYVGGLVVALSLCFHVLGFARVLQTYFELDATTSIIITGSVLCLFAMKNVFDLKLKMDVFHAIIYFLSFLVILFSVWKVANGWDGMFTFFEKHPEKRQLFPSKSDSNGWFSILIFLGVQWWSCYLFDGGGPEMARFTAVKGKKNAVLTGVLPILISLILSFFVLGHILLILGLPNTNSNHEIQYVESVLQVVPKSLKSLILLGFFGMFISTAESLLNWGASFLTIDAYKGYLQPESSEQHLRIVSFGTMILLSVLAMFFAIKIDSLQSLIKITFSIAAGVAPVYILRWIWFRINAWSQLSAMLSSALFTLLYPSIHKILPLRNFPMEESRVLVVTIITTIIWVLITLLTPNQEIEVRNKMLPILGSRKVFIKSFVLALFLGILLTLLITLCWYLILNYS
jgi:Na+/proline symporter